MNAGNPNTRQSGKKKKNNKKGKIKTNDDIASERKIMIFTLQRLDKE